MRGMYVDPRRSNPGRGYRSGGPAVASAAQVDEKKGTSNFQAFLKLATGAMQIAGQLGGAEAAGGTTSGGGTSGGTNNTGSLNIQDLNQNPHLPRDQFLGQFGGKVDRGTWDGNQWQSHVKPPDEVRPPSKEVPKQPDQSDTTKPPSWFDNIKKNPADRMKFASMLSDLALELDPDNPTAQASSAVGQLSQGVMNIKGMLEKGSEGGDDNEEEKKRNQTQSWYLRNPLDPQIA